MTGLTSTWAFYGSLTVSLVLPLVAAALFTSDPSNGNTAIRQLQDELRMDFADVRGKLEGLLKSGFDRSFLVITFKNSELFFQFRKYIHAKGDYGIELGFPLAPWSEGYVRTLRDYCAANGIAYTVGPDVADDRLEFLHVDFGKDDSAAFRMAKAIVSKVFRIPLDSDYDWEFRGLHPFGQLVNDPRQRPPSEDEVQKRQDKVYGQLGPHLINALRVFLVAMAAYVGIIGLLHSLIWKSLWAVYAYAPGWGVVAVPLLDTTITPRVFDLVCIGLIVLARAIGRNASGRTESAEPRESRLEFPQWVRAAGRVFPRRLRLPALIAATIAFWIA